MKGEVVYLYAFDVANEILLSRVGDLLSGRPMQFAVRESHTLPKDVPFYRPHAIELQALNARMEGAQVFPHIHIYEVGVVSVVLRSPVQAAALQELQKLHRPVLDDGRPLGQVAQELCRKAMEQLSGALVQPVPELLEPEAYTVFCLTDTGSPLAPEAWLAQNRNSVASLLTESEPGSLSDMQVNEVLRIHRSYANTDLAVIDWDAALVVDHAGYMEDTLYVLELANLQLEEYKVMDRRLDRYLDKAYEDIQSQHFRMFGTYAAKLRRLRTLRVDVTKLHDEVTHITKFFGDWYLARVYMGARERFHLNQWRNSVEERLRQIDALYTVAHTELTNQRMLLMEFLVVILFIVDIISLFLLKK